MKLSERIQGKKRIGIAGHINPDGDCIGSSLAIYNYIVDSYKDVDVHVFLQSIPHIFDFFKNSDKIEEPGKDVEPFDLFIVVDCGDLKRLGPSEKYFKEAKETFCIDHHVSNNDFADYNDVEPDNSSACEMVYDRMEKDKITKEIAECLYTGIVTDTGVFQYSCTSSDTMKAAGFLMDKGIDYPYIVNHVFFEKAYNQNRILGIALQKAKLYLDNKVIFSHVSKKEMKEFCVEPKQLEGIVSSLRSTKGVEVAIFCYDTIDNALKISLRSTDYVDVAAIASTYGGGGHKKASGCIVRTSLDKFLEDVLVKIKEQL